MFNFGDNNFIFSNSFFCKFFLLFVALATLVISIFGIAELKTATDYRIFFKGDNFELKNFKSLNKTFGDTEDFLIVLSFQDDVLKEKNLSIIRRMTDLSWKIPYVVRVDSITNFPYTYTKNKKLHIENLFSNVNDALDLERKKFALTDPSIKSILLSNNGRNAVIRSQIAVPIEDRTKQVNEILAAVDKIVADFKQRNKSVGIRVVGQAVYDKELDLVSKTDAETIYPILFLVALMLIGFFYQSIMGIVLILVYFSISVFSAFGFAGWIGASINPIVSMAPVILFVFVVCHGIHIFNVYSRNLANGKTVASSSKEAVRITSRPIVLTTFSTILGFLSLNFSQSPPFRDLGNMVAFGCFVTTLWMLITIHLLLTMSKAGMKVTNLLGVVAQAQINICTSNGIRNILMIFLFFPLLLLGVVSVKSQVSDDYLKYFSENNKFREITDFVDQNVTSLTLVYYVLEADESIADPRFANDVSQFVDWLRQQPEVSAVKSFTDTLKRLNMNMNEGSAEEYTLPESKELLAQYILLYELSLPFGMDVSNEISIDRKKILVKVFLSESSGESVLRFEKNASSWLDERTASIASYYPAGTANMFSHIGQRNIEGMFVGLGISLFVIAILLGCYFRSLLISVICVVMNVVPLAAAFGAWYVLGGVIDIGVAVVLGMAYGIIVDDTIHIINAWYEERESRLTTERIKNVIRRVFPAIYITTIVFVLGFGVLCFSDFQITFNTGFVTALAIFFAGLIDVLIVPYLFLTMSNHKASNFQGEGV